MSIVWQDHWDLGIEIMDAEHRALIAALNRLIEDFAQAPLSSEDPQTSLRAQALMEALEAFGIQARAHFDHEERFMRAIDYPHLGAHASEHALLHAEFIEMLRAWKQQRITRLDAETLIALRRWLVGHLLDADREYAQYYYTHCLSASRPR